MAEAVRSASLTVAFDPPSNPLQFLPEEGAEYCRHHEEQDPKYIWFYSLIIETQQIGF